MTDSVQLEPLWEISECSINTGRIAEKRVYVRGQGVRYCPLKLVPEHGIIFFFF